MGCILIYMALLLYHGVVYPKRHCWDDPEIACATDGVHGKAQDAEATPNVRMLHEQRFWSK